MATIPLHFPTFNLYGNGCYNDYVDIYGGSDLTAPLIGRYCGNYFSSVDGNVTSAGSSLLLVFVSSSMNADGQYKGFHAQFWTVYDDTLDAGTIAVIVVMCLLSLSVLLPLTYVLTTAYLLPCFKKTCGKEQANSAQSASTGEADTADNESFDGFEAPDFPPPYYSISGEQHQTGTHVQIDGVGSDSASPMPNALSETVTAGAGSGIAANSTFSNAGYEADARDEQSAPSLPSYEEVLKLAKDEKDKEC
ncbi:uncharacterized protein [Ptychodera flava]|uniref:uncharacterized protein n=1 Tax=Ptychodera flava TaxID=63121 RepID=UPI003969D053